MDKSIWYAILYGDAGIEVIPFDDPTLANLYIDGCGYVPVSGTNEFALTLDGERVSTARIVELPASATVTVAPTPFTTVKA